MHKLLIVGLGNPGSQYAHNRHNIGFMVLDILASHFKLRFVKASNFSIASLGDFVLCKPLTFMNHSGEAIRALQREYPIQDMLVVHDDLDLALGELRFKRGGGSGGHNGLKSIDAYCGSDYMRIRCGIGRPENKSQVNEYVLGDFEESPAQLLKNSLEALLFFLENRDFVAMQNRFTLKSLK